MNSLSGELDAMTHCRLTWSKNMTWGLQARRRLLSFPTSRLAPFIPGETRIWPEASRFQSVKRSGCSLPSESVENRHDNTHMHEKLQRPLHTEPTLTQAAGMLFLVALVPYVLVDAPRESTASQKSLSRYPSLLRLPQNRSLQSPQGEIAHAHSVHHKLSESNGT